MRASTRERIRPARSPPRPPARRAPRARSAPGRDRARATRRVVFPAWPDVHTRERAAAPWVGGNPCRSEEHTSELQSQSNLVCRLLLEKKKKTHKKIYTEL